MCLLTGGDSDWGRYVLELRYQLCADKVIRSFLACVDGALHMWQTKSNFVRPSMTIEGAHVKGTEPGSVVFSVDGRTVLTRGGDDTVKRMPRLIFSSSKRQLTPDIQSLGSESLQEAFGDP